MDINKFDYLFNAKQTALNEYALASDHLADVEALLLHREQTRPELDNCFCDDCFKFECTVVHARNRLANAHASMLKHGYTDGDMFTISMQLEKVLAWYTLETEANAKFVEVWKGQNPNKPYKHADKVTPLFG